MSPLLDIRNLHARFRTPAGIVRAVNGVSLGVGEGETVGIVGESGSGKSVLMLSVMRLLPRGRAQVSGEVLFEGRDLLKLGSDEMREVRGNQIAMIFQDPMTSLNPVLSVGRQLTEAIELHMRLDPAQAQGRAVELLRMVGIPAAEQRLRDFPHQFSGGQRQRVMIAMGLACVPQLLIADEPTTALDVTIQAQIVDLIRQVRREMRMAIVWITHDLSLLASLADRIAVMYAGQIVEEGPRAAIFKAPRHPYTIGLLRSIPRLDQPRRERLVPIPGTPPDALRLPPGCPFAPRCPFAIARCVQEDPPLEFVGPAHTVACWVKPTLNDEGRRMKDEVTAGGRPG